MAGFSAPLALDCALTREDKFIIGFIAQIMESSLHKNPHSRRKATRNWIYIRGKEEKTQTLTTPRVHETYNNKNGNNNVGDKNNKSKT